MRAELLDIDGDRRGETLGAQYVEPRRCAVGARQQGQVVLRSRLVGGDQGRGVLNGGIWSRQVGDPRIAIHAARPPFLPALYSAGTRSNHGCAVASWAASANRVASSP